MNGIKENICSSVMDRLEKKVECLRLYLQALSFFDRNKTFIQSAMVSKVSVETIDLIK